MIILKCVQVLNSGYIKRWVSVQDDEQKAQEYIDAFNKDNRFFRESSCEKVSSFNQITVEDCKNNSIEDFNKILSLNRAIKGDYYLTRNDVIELINSILANKDGESNNELSGEEETSNI